VDKEPSVPITMGIPLFSKKESAMTETPRQPDALLDTCGLFCPEPVMLLHGKVRELAAGTVLKVLASDPSTRRDIPRFCHFLGHELLGQSEQEGTYEYWIGVQKT